MEAIFKLEPVLNLMLEAAKRNISVSDTLKVVDDDFGAATFVQITKDDITAIGKLRPVGSRHKSGSKEYKGFGQGGR